MSKLVKIIIIVVSILLILLVAGYIAISSFLTPERVRQISEQIASQSLDRPVQIGKVNLTIGFRISISVEDVMIPNVKGFSSKPAITIDRTALNLRLLPLLQRRIIINSIDLQGLTLNLERNENKELNVLSLIPKETKGQAWLVSLDKLRLKNSELNYSDAVTKNEYRVHDINQEISFKKSRITIRGNQRAYIPENKMISKKDILLENAVEYDTLTKDINIENLKIRLDPAYVRVSGKIEKGVSLDLNGDMAIDDMSKLTSLLPDAYRMEKLGGAIKSTFSVSGTKEEPRIEGKCQINAVTIIPKGMKRAIENINGTVAFSRSSVSDISIKGSIGKTKFDIGGYISKLDSPSPLLNISTELDGNLKDFESLTSEMRDIEFSGPIAAKIMLKGNLKDPRFSGNVTVQGARIDGIGMGKPVSDLNFKAEMQNDAVKISECRGRIGRSDFSLTGAVSNFKKPVVQMNNRSNFIDLDELLPQKGTASSRSGKTQAGKPIPLTLQGAVVINRLTGLDMEFTNVNANFSYIDGVIDLKDCRAQTYGGQVNFDFYYNAYSPEPYRINTRMTSLDAQKIAKRFLGFDRIKGDLSGVANFNGNGLDEKSVRSNMNGTGNIKITGGEFNNFDFLVKLLGWMGLKDQRVITFRDFNSGFRITNGRASADDWTLSAKIGDFLTKGTIRLDGAVDLRIAITLTQHYSNIVKRYHGDWIFFTDKDGRTLIDVIAKGKLSSPQFTLDRSRIQQRIKGTIKNEFEKKIKDFESDLKDILRGIN
jgi:AsmA protein